MRPGQSSHRIWRRSGTIAILVWVWTWAACRRPSAEKASGATDAAHADATAVPPLPSAASSTFVAPRVAVNATSGPQKVDLQDEAMGTNVHFMAFSDDQADIAKVQLTMSRALAEMRRLAGVLSEWRDDSEVGKINRNPDHWISVGPETFAVIARALEEGKASGGTFDITFQAMSGLWKFGSAAEAEPKVPAKADVEQRRKLVDYRVVELDSAARAVRIPKGHLLGLGGIAKGYIVDRAADIFRQAGVQTFLVQAGGDLYGAGKKPDGSPWISGIQDPRAPEGVFFATIELTDHAFSTAGDYARSYVIGNRRYHHIIDPRTGYPATASRSVTVWADDATTADAIDDAVFILGPERGLKLVAANPGVGVVIVDKNNKVWISPRLQGKVHVTRQPTDGI
jgi:thiamine biosynthesis lipoprotein